MVDILIAIAILGGLGLVFGLVLAIASKVFYVETDPRLDALNEVLPGANCGGCGYAGCGGYAQAVLEGKAPVGQCLAGGDECAQKMAEIMGVKAETVARRVAMVRCTGYRQTDDNGNPIGLKMKGYYEGVHDCVAATKVAGRGPTICKFGCLGFGNCVKACKYDAIHIVDGVARVDFDKCVGCMSCAAACPRGIITSVEYGSDVIIGCASHAKGSVTMRGCTKGCVGCGMCVKICPKDAITIDRNLAVIDYSKCDGCGLCATVCPKHMIQDAKLQTRIRREEKMRNG